MVRALFKATKAMAIDKLTFEDKMQHGTLLFILPLISRMAYVI
jgi:hypothetical protein